MPDEVGTEQTRSDAPSADDSPFGEAADDKAAAAVEEEDSTDQTEQDGQGSDDAGEQDADDEAPQDEQAADDAQGDASPSDDLKVVVSIKGGRATIGVQRPSADPHIETFGADDLSGLAQELVPVTERARAKWEDAPKHPAYERPAPPARNRNRRQQTAQATPAETEAAQAQQQTLKLF